MASICRESFACCIKENPSFRDQYFACKLKRHLKRRVEAVHRAFTSKGDLCERESKKSSIWSLVWRSTAYTEGELSTRAVPRI